MKVFEKGNIGNIEVENRFVRSGTWMCKAEENGELTEELIQEYEKLAKGGLGLVVVGYSRVLEEEKANNGMIGMYDDKFIPRLKEFTSMFHETNTPVGIQLAIGGTQIHYDGDVTWDIMSPSDAIVSRKDKDGNELEIEVQAMSEEQIAYIINSFAKAAKRVKDSGFDLVQIHAGHGYFVSQWMNPKLNKREDEYGKDKTKFVVELYKAIRKEVGIDFPVGIKINSEEEVGDFSNHDAMLELCKKLDELGIDLIEVSGTAPSRTRIKLENESYFKEFATKLARKVKCSTMLTGGNKTLSNMNEVFEQIGVDFIGISRPLVSESDLILKWQENKEYVTRCISCNHCHRKIYTCVFDVNN